MIAAALRRFLVHLWRARPGVMESAAASLAWAVLVPACVMAGALYHRAALPPEALRIGLISAIAAAVSAPASLWILRIVPHDGGTRGIALAILALATLTTGLTALIFAYDFWWYFAQWHGTRFSRLWFIQLVFTFASAIYQFLVSGLRLHVPFAALLLFPAALLLARRTSRPAMR